MMSSPKSAAVALMAAGLVFAFAGYVGGAAEDGPQGDAPEPQAGGNVPAPAMQPSRSANFDDETLSKFADAYLDLQEIRIDYTTRLQTAEDKTQAQQLQQEASEKMLEALQENDLEVEQYNRIAMTIQTDSRLREKVAQIVTEAEQ